ncbi:MAG: cyclic nucleotide-binding domain-containing protein [Roseimicrobium sp.]
MKLPNIFESETQPLLLAAGDIVFSSGDEGVEMFVVREGTVEIRVGGLTVETVGPDGFFGEMALIEGGPRTATAVAKTDCKLIPINAKRFEFMVHEVPFFAISVMRGLSRRLRNINSVAE